mmetsp:Transcript_3162/g.12085  ORF Transcript_3162/g.12085 Transcript_3162/m.12085 type:complete len:309 (-) Transcript_3162:199-1125(-)
MTSSFDNHLKSGVSERFLRQCANDTRSTQANLTNLTEHYGAVLALPFGTGPNHAAYYCCPKNVTVEECSSGDYLEYLDDLDQACGWKNGDNADAQPYFDDIDDIAYTKTIAKFLTEEMCVDADKIFATGLSDGGAMTARAACDAADVLAGVASMSGGLALKDCVPAKPIAYLEFCGTLDAACNVSSYSTYSLWAEANECDEKGAKYHLTYESATTRCRAAESCSTLTEQCMIAGLGDDIPGHDRSAPLPPSTINILQAASNVDSVKYAFDKWSALFQSDQWPDMTFPGSFVDSSSTVMIKENVASSSS